MVVLWEVSGVESTPGPFNSSTTRNWHPGNEITDVTDFLERGLSVAGGAERKTLKYACVVTRRNFAAARQTDRQRERYLTKQSLSNAESDFVWRSVQRGVTVGRSLHVVFVALTTLKDPQGVESHLVTINQR